MRLKLTFAVRCLLPSPGSAPLEQARFVGRLLDAQVRGERAFGCLVGLSPACAWYTMNSCWTLNRERGQARRAFGCLNRLSSATDIVVTHTHLFLYAQGHPTRLSDEEDKLLQSLKRLDADILKRVSGTGGASVQGRGAPDTPGQGVDLSLRHDHKCRRGMNVALRKTCMLKTNPCPCASFNGHAFLHPTQGLTAAGLVGDQGGPAAAGSKTGAGGKGGAKGGPAKGGPGRPVNLTNSMQQDQLRDSLERLDVQLGALRRKMEGEFAVCAP